MTIHEAIDQLKSLLDHCKTMRESGEVWVRDCEALRIAIAALRDPTRDQVEKVWTRYRGGCAVCLGTKPIGYGRFKNRGYAIDYAVDLVRDHIFVPDCKIYIKFCPMCGRPLTDEAVDIVMRRLEALKDEID